jgi:hypothetical protein
MADELSIPTGVEQIGGPGIPTTYHNDKITVTDTVGAALLGIIALILLIALLRSQARNRELIAQLQHHS